MPNPYYGETSQQDKAGGSGRKTAKGKKPAPSLAMKAGPFPGIPGKAGPNRSLGYPKVQQHTRSEGL